MARNIKRIEQLYDVLPARSLNNLFGGTAHAPPQCPGLAANNYSSGHQDGYCSESVGLTGPTGRKLRLIMQPQPYGLMGVMGCNEHNQMIGVTSRGVGQFRLVVFDSECRILSVSETAGDASFTSFSGGYFYLNDKYNAVVVTNNKLACYPTNHVQKRESVYAMNPIWTSEDLVVMITGQSTTENSLYVAMPVWQTGNPYLYWVLLAGNYEFGTSTLKSNAFIAVVEIIPNKSASGCTTKLLGSQELHNQWNNNTLAVSEQGVFFVTNACDDSGACTSGYLHSFRFDSTSRLSKVQNNWSTSYQNSGYLKVGQTNIGSGTTPTLFQGKDGTDLVAITDNAYPKLHVVICNRATGEIIDQVPVFPSMRGCAEASLIGVNGHIVVENNFGHTVGVVHSQYVPNEPGLAMIKVKSSGESDSQIVWENAGYPSGFLAMSMLARESGVIFAHLCDWNVADSATKGGLYSIAAIDSWDGRIVWRIPLGQGIDYCHDYGGIYFNRTGSGTSIYVGTMGYFVSIQDVQ